MFMNTTKALSSQTESYCNTKDFLDKFAGAWEGPESAEEIIANIRSSCQSRNELFIKYQMSMR